MKTIVMTRTTGVRKANTEQHVGNITAAYLVDHGYAEYKGQPRQKNTRGGSKKRTDAITTDDVFGAKD